MNYEYFKVDKSEGVCTLLINRPEKYNAFNWAMTGEFAGALKEINSDKDVRVLVITGSGKAFCTGMDMDAFKEIQDQGGLKQDLGWKPLFPSMVPVIAAVNGYAIGMGLSMTLSCDIRIAAEEAKFSFPFVHLSALPEGGSLYFLPKLVGISRAIELLLSGRTFNAKEAKEYGLVTEVMPAAQLMDYTYKLARRIADAPPLSVMKTKKGLYQHLDGSFDSAVDYEKNTLEWLFKTEDFQEAIKALMEQRKPIFHSK
jgi:2-(1,2-epoxy-1,2-dihydrophenyl)acetyl-CoA isomerase